MYLTKNELSFEKLSKEIQQIEVKLFNANSNYIAQDITMHKVYSWAQGSIPKANEVQALAYLKYGNVDKWMDLYVPSPQVALNILRATANDLLSRPFKNLDTLKKQIHSLSYLDALQIIKNSNTSQIKKITALTYIGWRHHLSILNKTSKNVISYSISLKTKDELMTHINKFIEDINPDSNFAISIMQKIRNTLTLDDFETGTVSNKIKKILLPYLFQLFE